MSIELSNSFWTNDTFWNHNVLINDRVRNYSIRKCVVCNGVGEYPHPFLSKVWEFRDTIIYCGFCEGKKFVPPPIIHEFRGEIL